MFVLNFFLPILFFQMKNSIVAFHVTFYKKSMGNNVFFLVFVWSKQKSLLKIKVCADCLQYFVFHLVVLITYELSLKNPTVLRCNNKVIETA